ncbi:MAG: hypothetical protein K2W85_01800 [Phycisphaerales bacterium]|nr:hypothetical protein [Phycisphaerales bacterium]
MAVAQGATLAQPIVLPIVNSGFERLNVTLRPGEQTNGAGGVAEGSGIMETPVNTIWRAPFPQGSGVPQSGVIVPGWRTRPGGTGSLAGVLNPNVPVAGPGGARMWMTGYSGNYVATAQAAIMQQTLNVRLEPATTYAVSFLAGIGVTDSTYSPTVQLFATPDLNTFALIGEPGVTLLAQTPRVQIDQLQFSVMRPYGFTYTTPSVLPPELVSKYLTISFLGSDGFPRVNYDDFQVTAIPAPNAGALVLIAAIPLRRRRRH